MEYLVGAERFQVQPGDLLVIPPEVSHCPLLPEDLPQPYIRDVIWFRPPTAPDRLPQPAAPGWGSSCFLPLPLSYCPPL